MHTHTYTRTNGLTETHTETDTCPNIDRQTHTHTQTDATWSSNNCCHVAAESNHAGGSGAAENSQRLPVQGHTPHAW